MTKLESVRSKVIKAVPEIIEIKLGCKMLEFYSDRLITFVRFDKQGKVKCFEDKKFRTLDIDISDCKILGREISLSDCLLALKIDEVDGSDDRMSKAEALILMWNKYDNCLSEQREPTIKFLDEILTN